MNERIRQLAEQAESSRLEYNSATMMTERIQEFDKQKFAKMIIEECAREVEEFARKWWSIHCYSNKHAETTRKAHDDFCSLQAAIRRRGKTE
jgi:hypothetical protein